MWSDKKARLRRLAFDAGLLTLALIFSYVEALFPIALPFPGFKLGLANVIVLWLAVNRTVWDAGVVSFLRILIVAMLFGTPVSFWFSFGGAFFSFLVVVLVRRSRHISYIGASVLSASAHNFGQLVAASCLFGITTMLVYLPILLAASVVFGTICGMLLNTIAPRLKGGHIHL